MTVTARLSCEDREPGSWVCDQQYVPRQVPKQVCKQDRHNSPRIGRGSRQLCHERQNPTQNICKFVKGGEREAYMTDRSQKGGGPKCLSAGVPECSAAPPTTVLYAATQRAARHGGLDRTVRRKEGQNWCCKPTPS